MMKRIFEFATLVVFCLLGVTYVMWMPADSAQAVAAPPLSLDGLLDEKLPEAPKHKSKIRVDNSACYVCHGNYDGEGLVMKHGAHEIGCIDCHGDSFAHRNDEGHLTPPDIMYAAADVDRKCSDCHEDHDVSARHVIARWQNRCPEKKDPRTVTCTDCHFQHRLDSRQVEWDKKTRKVLTREDSKS